ncbi:hypothetical protein ACFXAF_28405 [Kitasatospora sp. NPDC059463]|uniref:hypothetical protein n=1 Tax=unclassified Kitasatospora TaxID=2633591 RepID=UPI00367F79F9
MPDRTTRTRSDCHPRCSFARILVVSAALDLAFDVFWEHDTTTVGTLLTLTNLAVAYTLLCRVPVPAPAEPSRLNRLPRQRGPLR